MGMKIHVMSHDKVRCDTLPYFFAKFGGIPMELIVLKLNIGLQQRHAHLPSSWLITQAASLSTPCQRRIWNLAQIDNHGVYLIGIPWQSTTVKNHIWWSQGEETRLPPPQEVTQIWMWIALEATIDTTITQDPCCFIAPQIRLTIEIWWWSTIPISKDNRLSHFGCNKCSWKQGTPCPWTLLEISINHYLKM